MPEHSFPQIARSPAPGAGSRSAAGRGRDDWPVRAARDHRWPPRERVPDFGNSTATRRALRGFSPLDYQDKPKVEADNDGKPRTTSPKPRSAGSRNFSRFLRSLLESEGPWVDGMVRQLRERAELPDFGERLGYDGKAVDSHRSDQLQDRQDPRRRPEQARDDEREDRQSLEKGDVVVRLWVWPPSTRSRQPSASSGVKSRDQRAGRGQAGNAGDALQGLQRGPGAAGRQSCETGPLHAPDVAGGKERCDSDKPLFDDNVYRRGEAPVLKPASNGTGFEADRDACGALKYRCRAAPGRRAVRIDKHDRRLFTPTPWGSPSRKRGPPFRPGSTAGPTTLTEKHCRRCLRLGLLAVAAMALGCLRAERQGGRWLAGLRGRSPRSSDRSPETGCLRSGHAPARPGFAAQRRSNPIFSRCSEN